MYNLNFLKRLIYILFLCLNFFCCKDDIEIELTEGEPQIVIEAFLKTEKGFSFLSSNNKISVSYSIGFSNEHNSKKPIKNATIFISNEDESNKIVFNNYSNGFYYKDQYSLFNSYKYLSVDSTYVLHVILENGRQFQSEKLTVPSNPPFDSLFFVTKRVADIINPSISTFNDQDYYPMISLKDDSLHDNFYVWTSNSSESFAMNPSFSDEFLIPGANLPDETLLFSFNAPRNNQLFFYQYALTKEAYEYFTTIRNSVTEGTPFATPPGPIKTNIYEVGNPKTTVLGFFSIADFQQSIKTPAKEKIIDYYPFN